MIKSISISNFQAHKNTHIDFTPGFNVITGVSDAGKSSVLRALLWVINNRPSGDDIKNWDMEKGDETSVDVTLTTGQVISKVKGKEAIYRLSVPKKIRRRGETAAVLEFKAFSQNVPLEVQDAFNLNTINIQSQHGKYFMLDDSPGDVAQQFNSLAGLDIIDRMFKNLNSYILQDKRSIDAGASTITGLKKDIDKLGFLDDAKIDVQKLGELETQEQSFADEIFTCSSFLSSIKAIESEEEKTTSILKAENQVVKAQELKSEHIALQSNENLLQAILESLNATYEQISIEEEWLFLEEPYDRLVSMKETAAILDQETDNLTTISRNLKSIEDQFAREQSKYETAQKQYKALLLENKSCPVCGGKIDDKCIKKILEG